MSTPHHEGGESFAPRYETDGGPIDDLIARNPDAIELTIEQETASSIPAHERDIDNRWLCEEVFHGFSQAYYTPAGTEKDREAFIAGMRWAYALACKTDMEQPPRLRDGYNGIEMKSDKRIRGIINEALSYGMKSEIVPGVINELVMATGLDEDGLTMARHGMLIGLHLINNGEDEKLHETHTQKYFIGDEFDEFDDLEEELRLDEQLEDGAETDTAALTDEEDLAWQSLVGRYYGKSS